MYMATYLSIESWTFLLANFGFASKIGVTALICKSTHQLRVTFDMYYNIRYSHMEKNITKKGTIHNLTFH